MSKFRPLLITLAMVAGLVALLVGLWEPFGNMAAEHWRKQLQTVPDENAKALLEQVATLGEPGIPVLVEALGSSRESVARAARKVLVVRLEYWQKWRHRGESAKLGTLARELAAQVEGFDHTARSDAADLASRILLWPPDARQVDRGATVAACEKVLRTAFPGYRPPKRPAPASELDDGDQHPGQFHTAKSIEELARLPGGGLPVSGLPADGSPMDGSPVGGMEVPAAEPNPTDRPIMADDRGGVEDRAQPEDLSRRPPRLLTLPEKDAGKPVDEKSAPGEESALGQESTEQEVVPHPASVPAPSAVRALSHEQADRPTGLESEETIDLMRRLQGDDEAEVRRCVVELSRRGLTTLHFELARRLFDPDPKTRIELARALPAMQTVDAARWLLYLSRDEDADVRLVAIGLMATTGDPTLLAEIERIATSDSDPRIRRQAQRISAQRR